MLLPWQDMQSLGGARDANKGRGMTKLYQRKGQIDLELAGLELELGSEAVRRGSHGSGSSH